MNTDPATTSGRQNQVWLSGEFVPESVARLSAFDRGCLYGDGLFETIRVFDGRIPLFDRHLARLEEGLRVLRFQARPKAADLRLAADQLRRRNEVSEGVLRLQVTRGIGSRGYSPRGVGAPTILLSTHPLPLTMARGWRVMAASVRVWSGSPLNRVKSTSKALHVLARGEADDQQADEALLLNERGELVEATAANLFWIRDGCLVTPPIDAGALPGITRAEVMRLAGGLGLSVTEMAASPADLFEAEGVFLTNSVRGVVTVGELDGRPLSVSGWVERLRTKWLESLATGD
jgi:aminodeoxychorismate lyase